MFADYILFYRVPHQDLLHSAQSDSSLEEHKKCPESCASTTLSFRENCERNLWRRIRCIKNIYIYILEIWTLVIAYVSDENVQIKMYANIIWRTWSGRI